MGKSEPQLPINHRQNHQNQQNRNGSSLFSQCSMGFSRFARLFSFKCVFVLILGVAVSLSAIFSVFHLHRRQSGFDASGLIKDGATLQAYFKLEKPVSFLISQITRLEYDISGEIGVPGTQMEQTGNNQKAGGVHLDPIADQLAAIIAKLDSLIALKKDVAAIKEAWLERRTDAIKEAGDENQDPVTDLGMEKIPCNVSMPRATPITTTQAEKSPLISDLEKKMLEVADETDAQTSPEEEEHKNHGETKNAELEQKLFSRDAVLKSLCGYSHKDHTKTKTDKKPLDWSFQKAIKGWMDDKEDWPTSIIPTFRFQILMHRILSGLHLNSGPRKHKF